MSFGDKRFAGNDPINERMLKMVKLSAPEHAADFEDLLDALKEKDYKRLTTILAINGDLVNQHFLLKLECLDLKHEAEQRLKRYLPNFTRHVVVTCLHYAVLKEDLATTSFFLYYKADPNAICTIGYPSSVSRFSVPHKSNPAVKVDKRPTEYTFGLHLATVLKNFEIVDRLLTGDSDPTQRDGNKLTPLDLSFFYPDPGLETSEILLKAFQGMPSSVVSIFNIFDVCKSSEVTFKLISLMIDAEYDVDNIGNKDNGLKMIMQRLNMRHPNGVALVEKLINRGYDMSKKLGFNKDSFLHLAVAQNSIQLVRLLIENGLEVNEENKRKETPIHHLLYCGSCDESLNLSIFKLLIENGAELEAETCSGNDVFSVAVIHRRNSIVAFLVCDGYNRIDSKGNSPFHVYCSKGLLDDEVFEVFTRKGDFYSINGKNGLGRTPLHCLLARLWSPKDYKRVAHYVCLLVSLYAELSATDNNGDTPLMVALHNNLSFEVIKLLISCFGGIDVRNTRGLNAFDLAVEQGLDVVSIDVIQLLLNRGFKVPLNVFKESLQEPLRFELIDCFLEYCEDIDINIKFPDILLIVIDGLRVKDVTSANYFLRIVEKLVEKHNIGLNRVNEKGASALHLLLFKCRDNSNVSTAKKCIQLLAKNKDIDLNILHTVRGRKRTPFETAFYFGYYSIAEELFRLFCVFDETKIKKESINDPGFSSLLKLFYETGFRGLVYELNNKISGYTPKMEAVQFRAWLKTRAREVPSLQELAANGVRTKYGNQFEVWEKMKDLPKDVKALLTLEK